MRLNSNQNYELFDPYMERLEKAVPLFITVWEAVRSIVLKYFVCLAV